MINIILGSTHHARFKPKKHQFTYPLYMLEVDIEQLDLLNQGFFTSYNKRNLLSIFDQDHLQNNDMPISEKVLALTKNFKHGQKIKKTNLVTIPRLIFKTFRPVSFYLCYGDNQEFLGMIAEVSNTYKEAYYYMVESDGTSNRVMVDKQFHVSPFFEETGQYGFRVKDNDKRFEIHIDYEDNDNAMFYANFKGEKKKLSGIQLIKLVIVYPLTALMVFPRILFQAFKLYAIKKVKHYSKPKLDGDQVLRSMPLSRMQRLIFEKIKRVCDTLDGKLTITLPDHEKVILGKNNDGPKAEINILNNWFFNSIRKGGEVGLGESYMKGEWDSPDLASVITYMVENKQNLESNFKGSIFMILNYIIRHKNRRNSLRNSKQNIADHYDLGNSFYQLFLDETMMYSSGLYKSKEDSLTIAQQQKVDRLIRYLNVTEGDHVLEIGSGWGYTAIEIAKKYKCKVTTITLSEEQKKYVELLVNKEELADLVEVKLEDYRNVVGIYDAIISVEMLEAVGHEYLGVYFEACSKLLKEGGIFALQAITYPNKSYNEYRKGTDFIRQHIFPGGHLPSLGSIANVIENNTNLVQINTLNIADSYAKTLLEWRHQFLGQQEALNQLGFDQTFIRKWEYYFAYCEAAFKTGFLGCYQMHYRKG